MARGTHLTCPRSFVVLLGTWTLGGAAGARSTPPPSNRPPLFSFGLALLPSPIVLAVSLSLPPTRYPAAADDNQYHLQALRHLYVLAVQRRGVDAVDVDTGESVFVPISVAVAADPNNDNAAGGRNDGCGGENDDDGDGDRGSQEGTEAEAEAGRAVGGRTSNTGGAAAARSIATSRVGRTEGAPPEGGGRGAAGRTLALVTPCVLPDLKGVSRLSIRSPRYFPVELDVAGNPAVATALQRRCRIYVKRRVGHLSYKNVSVAWVESEHSLRWIIFSLFFCLFSFCRWCVIAGYGSPICCLGASAVIVEEFVLWWEV